MPSSVAQVVGLALVRSLLCVSTVLFLEKKMRRGHDQSPGRNDTEYEVWPPHIDHPNPNVQPQQSAPATHTNETTDDPERHTAATFRDELKTCCAAIAMHMKIREVDPWFQGIVEAIDRTSAVWTLSRCDGEWKYLAIVEGNQMFPTPRAIRKAKTFSLALAWAFQDWLEQREQD